MPLLSLSTGKTNKTVDVDKVSALVGTKREDVVRKLQDWNDSGLIKLTPSGVVNRYRMIKPFPRGKEAGKLIALAYEQMEQREIDDLRRSKQVIELITSERCFAIGLASHFGDEVGEKCGRCGFCITGKKVQMGEVGKVTVAIDEKKVQAILKACDCRDDPRLLARIGFGISSPRVLAAKCGARNPVFGSMAECDFDVGLLLGVG